ncbi:uncharacterized protein LOC131165411 [Malania oleifera]|uniref:uncharacterized protein LOC131165411 n=1 Tax=Malania oleifera TaxID=397392 RepID=UPI0025AEC7CE|nr:uncharacterized protein LOC131165411 [Malania oleifera]XP_057979182.1 uncharacterized protein LOC131165411 [Malania oleifera]XP_057979183.1 uncharacterized protein LOC131165411 [Malania oleifera]
MKRKKWSELEEQTLLSKYSDLLNSGTLSKLKTREKKFKPIADHVNSVHHLQDPINFPFKWSWRDVSIKVQNMRHQYLGVKQKIRVSEDKFDWKDGENHWENFLKYKEVFGDVDLDAKGKRLCQNVEVYENCGCGDDDDVLGLEFGIDCEDLEECGDDDDGGGGCDGSGDNVLSDGEFCSERGNGDVGFPRGRKLKKGFECGGEKVEENRRRLGLLGAQVLELRDLVVRREERRREREWTRDKGVVEGEELKRAAEVQREAWWRELDEGLDRRELELEERQLMWAKQEFERRVRLEREFNEERRKRMKLEEKREEEEMEWRERMLSLQIEHEKQMMQLHADACQNQMQILGVMARLVCQFFGSANDGLGGGLGTLPPQVLQNLQHPGGLTEAVKPDPSSPSEFL